MDLRAYYIQAAEAAAAAVHAADDDDDDVPELAPKAVLLKLEVQGVADAAASRQGSDIAAATAVGNAEAGKAAGGGGGGGGRDLTCPECGKAFLSDKAMYGHLRSHPERGYKGATRPTTASGAAAAVAGDKKVRRKAPRKDAELSAANMAAAAAKAEEKKPWPDAELAVKWPVKAKRGRTPCVPSNGSAPGTAAQSSCSEDEEAAKILLDMASGCPTHDDTSGHQMSDVEQPMPPYHVAGHRTPGAEKPVRPGHVTSTGVAPPKMLEDEQGVRPEHVPEVSAESQTPEVKQLAGVELATDAVVVVARDKSPPARQPVAPNTGSGGAKKHKKRRLLDLEQAPSAAAADAADVKPPPARRIPSPASDKKHECPNCHKVFPTYQALGGHMASHVKGKRGARHDADAMAKAADNILAHQNQGGGDVIAGDGAGAGAVQERRNVQPPAPTPAQSTASVTVMHVCADCHMTFPSGQALGGHKRKHWLPEKLRAQAARAAAPRDFDLNELPKEDEAEGENQP
ncbi:hypothetical protein ACP70R_009804 [Stipagrostis hirtigluma subsp. patula]